MKKIKGIIIAVVAIVILAGGAFVLYKLGVLDNPPASRRGLAKRILRFIGAE